MKSKAIFGLFALIVVSFGFAALSARSVRADDHKVVICHATNSHKNPYTVNNVSKSSVDEPKNKYLNGHGDHTGPVWHSGIANHSWGDIIPPFTYTKKNGDTISYPGYNWTTEGQKWHKNNCNEPGATSTDYCDTTQVVGDVASWLNRNGMNGADCFDYSVEQRCGYVNVTITDQPQPYYAQGLFRAVYTTNRQVASPYQSFPMQFAEDFNGGSVDVTWFTVGPESDWLSGSNFPNFWSKVGQTITVDTDCKAKPTATIAATATCATVNGKMEIEVMLTNSGDADGEAIVNGDSVTVPANGSVTRYFDPGTPVIVAVDGHTILDKTLMCEPGRGGNTPSTPETPNVSGIPAVLPYTSGVSTRIVAAGALSFACLILVVGAAIKSRLIA